MEVDEVVGLKATASRGVTLYRSTKVALPLCVYAATASMFLPVFQSLVYQKVCEESEGLEGFPSNCSDRKSASSSHLVQTAANRVILVSSVTMCLIGGLSSALLGRLGDSKSRKIALLIPFTGLILADCTLILQAFFSYLSAYWMILSEAIFAIFGGYMSVISSSFAYTSDFADDFSPQVRSQAVAILEGTLGLGGTIGFFCAPLLPLVGFTSVFTAFSFLHLFCIGCIFLLPDRKRAEVEESQDGVKRPKEQWFKWTTLESLKSGKQKGHVTALMFSFGISFLAFIGSSHILFYYLKYRFDWTVSLYGLLKGPAHGLSTVATLFLYPLLRSRRISDCSLALVGLASRALGRLWIAIAWSSNSVFMLIGFDVFSRFAATGIRAMLANSVASEHHGSMFALIAFTEAACNLLAALVFHWLFPFSIPFLPQTSFFILAALLLIPIALLWSRRSDLSNVVDHKVVEVEMDALQADESAS